MKSRPLKFKLNKTSKKTLTSYFPTTDKELATAQAFGYFDTPTHKLCKDGAYVMDLYGLEFHKGNPATLSCNNDYASSTGEKELAVLFGYVNKCLG